MPTINSLANWVKHCFCSRWQCGGWPQSTAATVLCQNCGPKCWPVREDQPVKLGTVPLLPHGSLWICRGVHIHSRWNVRVLQYLLPAPNRWSTKRQTLQGNFLKCQVYQLLTAFVSQDCMKQHELDMERSFAIARSRDKACGICMEVIWEKIPAAKQRFGLLPNCSHCFW